MIGSWMIYCVGIGALLGAAALAFEHVFRLYDRPARLGWLAALVGSGVLPLTGLLWPRAESGAIAAPFASGIGIGPVTLLEGGSAVAEPWQGSLAAVDPLLLAIWAMMSGGLLAYFGFALSTLALKRASWRRTEVDGQRVFVAEDVGPCVVGFLRMRVVLPRWLAEMPDYDRRLALVHEREHVRALDPQLLLVAGLLLVAMPWNVPLWWQVRRLRLAVEMDCDRRVLARYPDKRGYGELLLRVGTRRQIPGALAFVALAEPKSSLERRIEAMTSRFRGNRRNRTLALVTVAGLALVFACEAAPPESPVEPGGAQADVSGAAPGGNSPALPPRPEPVEPDSVADIALSEVPPTDYARIIREAYFTGRGSQSGRPNQSSERPPANMIVPAGRFTPRDVEPELRNRNEVGAALQGAYPGMLRDAGVGGTAVIWFHINEQGVVTETQVAESSGYPALDEAAVNVGLEMEFTPAMNRGEVVPIWVQIPIEFRPVTQ